MNLNNEILKYCPTHAEWLFDQLFGNKCYESLGWSRETNGTENDFNIYVCFYITGNPTGGRTPSLLIHSGSHLSVKVDRLCVYDFIGKKFSVDNPSTYTLGMLVEIIRELQVLS